MAACNGDVRPTTAPSNGPVRMCPNCQDPTIVRAARSKNPVRGLHARAETASEVARVAYAAGKTRPDIQAILSAQGSPELAKRLRPWAQAPHARCAQSSASLLPVSRGVWTTPRYRYSGVRRSDMPGATGRTEATDNNSPRTLLAWVPRISSMASVLPAPKLLGT